MTNKDLETIHALLAKYGHNGFVNGLVTAYEEEADKREHGPAQSWMNSADMLRDVAEHADEHSYNVCSCGDQSHHFEAA